MPTFAFEDLSIAYDHTGSGDPVLFLHNLGGSREIWREQYDALAVTHRVYALDWPGYGDSTIAPGGYTIARHLRLLDAFAEAHDLAGVTLVGNCFGSAMALLHAQRRPDLVNALVLVNPLTAATLRPTAAGLAARLLRRAPLRPVAERLRLPGPVAALVLREQLGGRGRAAVPDQVASVGTRWSEPRRLVPLAAMLPELPELAALDDFRPPAGFPPITTVWGEQNRVLSPTAGRRLAENLRATSAITVPGCGHLVMAEDPETVTAAVRSAALNPSGAR